jgi:hypothetical protein
MIVVDLLCLSKADVDYREGYKTLLHEVGHHVSEKGNIEAVTLREMRSDVAMSQMVRRTGRDPVKLIDYGLREYSLKDPYEFMADVYIVDKLGNNIQKRNLTNYLNELGIDSIEDVYKQLGIKVPVQEIQAVRNGNFIDFITVDTEVDPAVLAATPWYYIADKFSIVKHQPGKHDQKLHNPHKYVELSSKLPVKGQFKFPAGEYESYGAGDTLGKAYTIAKKVAGVKSAKEVRALGYRVVDINGQFHIIKAQSGGGGVNSQPAMRPLVASKASMGEAFPVDFPVSKTELRHSNENMISHFAGKPSPAQGGEKLKLNDVNVSWERRGEVKDSIVKDLTQRMQDKGHPVEYGDVNDTIGTWASTSNDESLMSLSLQKAAEEELGAKMSDWQKDNLKNVEKVRSDTYDWKFVSDAQGDQVYAFEKSVLLAAGKLNKATLAGSQPAASKAASKDFLRSMYNHTQDELKSAGVEYVTLYRGMRSPQKGFNTGDVGKLAKSNAMESWSINKGTAELGYFAGYGDGAVYRTIVPRDRILCTAMTGFGCLNEYEVLVLGNQPDDVVERIQ